MNKEQKEALAKLFQAIEHIKLPLLLSAEQANAYNALMYAETHVKTVFDWDYETT